MKEMTRSTNDPLLKGTREVLLLTLRRLGLNTSGLWSATILSATQYSRNALQAASTKLKLPIECAAEGSSSHEPGTVRCSA